MAGVLDDIRNLAVDIRWRERPALWAERVGWVQPPGEDRPRPGPWAAETPVEWSAGAATPALGPLAGCSVIVTVTPALDRDSGWCAALSFEPPGGVGHLEVTVGPWAEPARARDDVRALLLGEDRGLCWQPAHVGAGAPWYPTRTLPWLWSGCHDDLLEQCR